MKFEDFMSNWLSGYRANGGDSYCETEIATSALDAWNNRQALIDAHNRRMGELCARRVGKRQGCNGGDGFLCAECPCRYMIEDK